VKGFAIVPYHASVRNPEAIKRMARRFAQGAAGDRDRTIAVFWL
jgi:hypothetical protein